MCNPKTYIKNKNCVTYNQCVLESQMTKSDLKPLTNGLYPKHKMFATMFPLEPISTQLS